MPRQQQIVNSVTYLDFAKVASMVAGRSADWSASMLRLGDRLHHPVPKAVCERYLNEILPLLEEIRRIHNAV